MPHPQAKHLGAFLVACATSIAACGGHDVPDHDVFVTSDCRGATESARFHFDAFDFPKSCEQSLFDGSCSSSSESGKEGKRVSGDLEVFLFRLMGTAEFGPSRYELGLVPPGKRVDDTAFNRDDSVIRCDWPVDSDLELTEGSHQNCSFSPTPCSADLRAE